MVIMSLGAPAIATASSSMVMIPEGPFTMGQGNQPPHGPERRLFLGPFLIDKSEITHEEFQEQFPSYRFRKGAGQHPMTKVTWYRAKQYCEKIGGRLPTEPEWEKAARGTDGRTYPWGNEPDETKANIRGKKDGYRYSAPVGLDQYGASPYGIRDMSGNVWEWTADWYQPHLGNIHPNDFYGEQFRVIKGGSWFSNMDLARITVRGKSLPDRRNNFLGFRCAK